MIPKRKILLTGDEENPPDLGALLEEFATDLEKELDRFYCSGDKTKQTYLNHCDKAVQDFGYQLINNHFFTSYKEEGIEINYFSLHGENPHKLRQENYHRLALLEIKDSQERKNYVALDLIYFAFGGGNHRTALYWSTSPEGIKELLKAEYGGTWRKEFELDQGKKAMRWLGDSPDQQII